MVRILLGVLAVVLVSTSVQAQTVQPSGSRWYVGLGLGYHLPGTIDSHSLKDAPDGTPYDWKWRSQNGGAAVANIGYRLSRHWRVELQSGFYYSAIDSVHAAGIDVGGVVKSRPGEPYGLCAKTSVLPDCLPLSKQHGNWTYMWTGMVNGIFDLLPRRRFDPFVGAGVGFAHIGWATSTQNYLFSKVPGVISADNPARQTLEGAGTLAHPSQFAVQFLAGVSYPLTHRLKLDTTYYYYFTPGELRWNPENSTPGLPVGAGLRPGDFLGHFHDQSLIVSLRYLF